MTPSPPDHTDAVARLCEQLGYDRATGCLLTRGGGSEPQLPHALREAFERIGIEAAFGVPDSRMPGRVQPFVYLARCNNLDAARAIHRRVWSQGLAPILILVWPGGASISKGLQPPPDQFVIEPFDPAASTVEGPLARYAADRLCSSSFWRDFRAAERGASVDERLIAAIRQVNQYVRSRFPELASRPGLVNRVIARTIYLGMLMDRGFVTREWLAEGLALKGFPASSFPEEMALEGSRGTSPGRWTRGEFWFAMDSVDAVLNGSVFEVTLAERGLLSDELLATVHGVIRRGNRVDEAGQIQGSFIDFSFDVIRTETISAMYQEFLHGEPNGVAAAAGAFYTPPFVADYLVDLVFSKVPPGPSTTVLDPACGSGIFLVAAYRRLLEASRPEGGWSVRHAALARSILEKAVFGIEKDEQAVNVARLALYMTLLDHLHPAGIEELAVAIPGRKLLPDLERNILRSDAFDDGAFQFRRFSHVLTNPPWDQSRGRRLRTNEPEAGSSRAVPAALSDFDKQLSGDRLPVGADRLSDRFVWLARVRFLTRGGVLGAVLPTKSLVGVRSQAFASAIAREFSIDHLVDLSQLRRALFVGAEAPATLVVARAEPAAPGQLVRLRRVTKASVPVAAGRAKVWTLLGADGEEDTCRIDELRRRPWHEVLALSAEDRRMADALRTLFPSGKSDFSAFLARSGLLARRGGDISETGLPDIEKLPRRRRTAKKPQFLNLWEIDSATLAAVDKSFLERFAGRVVLVPRSFTGIRYLEEPHAFRSTYKAIYTRDPALRSRESFVAGMKGLARCLDSGMFTYFAWLFGGTYAILGDRLELSDLERFPFPFETIEDPRLVEIGRQDVDVDEAFTRALGLSSDVIALVREHEGFLGKFKNANVPACAFHRPAPSQIEAYMARFVTDVARAFPPEERIEVLSEMQGGHFLFRFRRSSAAFLDSRPSGYIGVASIAVEPKSGSGVVLKSLEKHAFTLRQAAADARIVLRRITA